MGEAAKNKILISFYVSTKTLETLEDFLYFVKRQLPIEQRRSLTKSVFYETGFNILIDEFRLKGKDSSLYKAIQDLNKNKQ